MGKKALKVIGSIFGGLIGLIIVVYIILNITFSIQLKNKLAELKAQGRPTTIAEIVPPPVPDEKNAAILYNKAFKLMEIEEGKQITRIIGEIKSYSDISEWTDEQRKEISQLVNSSKVQYIYVLLEEGSKKPKCNFNHEYEKGPDMLLPELSPMRSATRLLCIKALIEAESGKSAEAFYTLLIGLKFANHFKDEPILISQLVRIACDQIIIECIKNISDSKGIPPENANLIINELSTHKDVEPFIKCMDGERVAFGGWGFEKIINSNMPFARIVEMEEGDDNPIKKRIQSLITILYKPILKKDYICYLTLMTKMQNTFNSSYNNTTQKIEDKTIDVDEQIPRYCILTRMVLPAIGRIKNLAIIHQANIDVCSVGLALKVYKAKNGTYPERLESLVPQILSEIPIDPFSGENLKYSRYIGGFKLYSIGPNMQDDFGTKRIYEKDSPAYENYDIVWKCGS
jgi:hypothetical protein